MSDPASARNDAVVPRPHPTRLPLTVIGGFLGAGKTTLLEHWLRAAGGRRLAVLVNDFGALNIDAALIAASGADTIALANGCVCCQIGDDLSAALLRVLDDPGRFDAIVIEASGVSDPWRIAQIGLADPALSLGGVIVLVDASALHAQAADPLLADTLQRQLDSADLVLLNKTDLVDAAELQRVHEALDTLAGPVPRLETRHAALPLALLNDLAPVAARAGGAASCARGCGAGTLHDDHHHPHPLHDHGDPDHGALFDHWSARPEGVYSLTALRAALRAVPPGVLRMKGWLRTDGQGWSELQFAGRHGSLRRALAVPPDGAALVAIGLRGRLSAPALDRWLAATQANDRAHPRAGP